MSKISAILVCMMMAVAAIPAAPSSSEEKININLRQTLATKSIANIMVSMAVGVQPAYDSIALNTYSTRQQSATAGYEALTALAEKSQHEILEMLKSPKYFTNKVQSFWVSNQIYIQGADKGLVELLASFDSVSKIDEEEIFHLIEPIKNSEPGPLESMSWGIDKIQSEEAWAFLDGNSGEGTVVGIIDTGARVTHQALRNSYKYGTHAWFSAYSTANSSPIDGQGHGTHVTGTIAGGNGIGVAPGAKWMACKGLSDDGTATTAALLACGQFMACPTDYQGNNPNCSEVPDVVSNSWGSTGGNTFFESVITAWRNAGIIPVFANGNSGDLCRTVGSPADSIRVIAVGATDSDDACTPWSSRGPTNGGGQKPDVSAPGLGITSASHESDSTYVTFSGTSMATPHVAGLAALLRAQNPDSFYVEIRNAMINSAERNLTFSGQVCAQVPDNQFPNFQFGYGRINALYALQAAKANKNK